MTKSFGHISKADECQLDEPHTEYDCWSHFLRVRAA